MKSQLLLADGAEIRNIIPPLTCSGRAIECRINAEDPEKFTPSPGAIKTFRVPGGNGVRIDSAGYAGVTTPYYDSLTAKLVPHGRDRNEAIMRMLRHWICLRWKGIHTTIPLHKRILQDTEFQQGHIDTKDLERLLAPQTIVRVAQPRDHSVASRHIPGLRQASLPMRDRRA